MSRDYMRRLLRREGRKQLTARCTITRGTWPAVETIATDVPCLPRPSQRAVVDVESGDDTVTLHRYDVRVMPDQDIRLDDVLTITRADDPNMAGRHLTVSDAPADDWVSLRHVTCQESRSST